MNASIDYKINVETFIYQIKSVDPIILCTYAYAQPSGKEQAPEEQGVECKLVSIMPA